MSNVFDVDWYDGLGRPRRTTCRRRRSGPSPRTSPPPTGSRPGDGVADRPGRLDPVENGKAAARAWRVLFPTWGALGVFVLTGVLAPVLLISLHVAQNPLLSPVDEINHYDYVTRMAEGSVPRFGQYILPSSVQQLECRGIALHAVTAALPPCGTPIPSPATSPLQVTLEQYEAQQPPTYYTLTVPLRWVAVHVFGFSDLTGTRLTGAVWLVAGLACLWAACRVLGLTVTRTGAGILRWPPRRR